MADENVFHATEEEKIRMKPIRKKNEQLLETLLTKDAKAYEIFKEALQAVHLHLANMIWNVVSVLTTTK